MKIVVHPLSDSLLPFCLAFAFAKPLWVVMGPRRSAGRRLPMLAMDSQAGDHSLTAPTHLLIGCYRTHRCKLKLLDHTWRSLSISRPRWVKWPAPVCLRRCGVVCGVDRVAVMSLARMREMFLMWNTCLIRILCFTNASSEFPKMHLIIVPSAANLTKTR